MRVQSLKKRALCALSLLLSACAQLPPSATVPAAQTVARPYAETLDLGGRLSVRYQNNGREEAVHGGFLWSQNPSHTSVTLLSPLGQTLAVIDLDPHGARLARSGQPVRVARDADTLVAETLGWPLPIAGLREWLQGFAVDASGRPFTANASASEVATRDGWHIRYPAWQNDVHASRPRRIDLERSTAQAGDVSIRIVIDDWRASP